MAKNAHTDLARERLLEVLDLNPDTYNFTWKYDAKNPKQRRVGLLAGTKNAAGGLQIHIDGVSYKAHRLVWLIVHGAFPNGHIDHQDGNPLNNHIDNLRIATTQQNAFNKKRPSNNTSGFKGVSYCKSRNKYEARIKVDGKHLSLGRFESADLAYDAYKNAAAKHFGEFHRIA